MNNILFPFTWECTYNVDYKINIICFNSKVQIDTRYLSCSYSMIDVRQTTYYHAALQFINT